MSRVSGDGGGGSESESDSTATAPAVLPLQKVVPVGGTKKAPKDIPASIWYDPNGYIHDGDDKGAFVHKVDGSEVILDPNTNLVFLINFFHTKTPRFGYLDLTHPVEPASSHGLWTDIDFNFGAKLYGLLAMEVGQVKYDEARFHGALDGDYTQARYGVTEGDGSSLARYTRVSPTQWVIETEGTNDIAQVTHGPSGTSGIIGLYHIPFRVVVNILQ